MRLVPRDSSCSGRAWTTSVLSGRLPRIPRRDQPTASETEATNTMPSRPSDNLHRELPADAWENKLVPLLGLFDVLGRRWTLRILWELRDEPATLRELRSR